MPSSRDDEDDSGVDPRLEYLLKCVTVCIVPSFSIASVLKLQ
jgi:hypothetical protein